MPVANDPLARADFDHASREVVAADVTRPLLALGYLGALAVGHGASAPVLLVGAVAGSLVGLALLRLTERRHAALRRMAMLRGASAVAPPLLGSLAVVLLLLVTLLDGAALWVGLRGQWPQTPPLLAPLLALLFVAWQWWFFLYTLSPTDAEEERPDDG